MQNDALMHREDWKGNPCPAECPFPVLTLKALHKKKSIHLNLCFATAENYSNLTMCNNFRPDILEILMYKYTFHSQYILFSLLIKQIKTDHGRS